jgi:hypothetical protein
LKRRNSRVEAIDEVPDENLEVKLVETSKVKPNGRDQQHDKLNKKLKRTKLRRSNFELNCERK